jgi:hypothetical protein
LNVRSFGATGDGTTVDTPAINKAIEPAGASGGGTVYFSAGSYLCYSIRLKSNVSLYLDQGTTIIAAELSDPAPKRQIDAEEQHGSTGYIHRKAGRLDRKRFHTLWAERHQALARLAQRTSATMPADEPVDADDLMLRRQQIFIGKVAKYHLATRVIPLPPQLGEIAQRGTQELRHRPPPASFHLKDRWCDAGRMAFGVQRNIFFVNVRCRLADCVRLTRTTTKQRRILAHVPTV